MVTFEKSNEKHNNTIIWNVLVNDSVNDIPVGILSRVYLSRQGFAWQVDLCDDAPDFLQSFQHRTCDKLSELKSLLRQEASYKAPTAQTAPEAVLDFSEPTPTKKAEKTEVKEVVEQKPTYTICQPMEEDPRKLSASPKEVPFYNEEEFLKEMDLNLGKATSIAQVKQQFETTRTSYRKLRNTKNKEHQAYFEGYLNAIEMVLRKLDTVK